jgi:predicted Zn-dependent protease with MMP-like domain
MTDAANVGAPPNDQPGNEPGYEPADEPEDPFEALVLAGLDSLPQTFRDQLGSVAIVIDDEPTLDQLSSVGAPGLLGLYTGVPRTAWGADGVAYASKITIFRGPHLRQFHDPEALARGVADTVRHEVAHHFGISDARLEEMARLRNDR